MEYRNVSNPLTHALKKDKKMGSEVGKSVKPQMVQGFKKLTGDKRSETPPVARQVSETPQ